MSESQTWGFLCLTGEISLSQAPCKWPVGRFGYSQSFQNKLPLWAQEQNFPKRRTAKQDTDDGLHQGYHDKQMSVVDTITSEIS